MSNSPNVVIRFGYLAALVLPLVKRTELFPAVIICALGIAKNTFAYPLMPTDMSYYVLLALAFAIISLKRRGFHIVLSPLFLIAFIYVLLNDLILQGTLSNIEAILLICILFYLCIGNIAKIDTQYFSLSFMLISLTISFWALFFPEAQVNSYNVTEDIEQTGWQDPNYLSATLGTGVVVAVKDLLVGNKKKLYIIISVLTVLATTFAMLQLASRGVLLAVVLAVVTLFVSIKSKRRIKIPVIILLALFVVFLYTNQYAEFLLARFDQDDGTANNRTVIWLSKIDEFFSNGNLIDWIFGIGQRNGVRIGITVGNAVNGMSTHNDYLSVLIYYGFVGVVLFLSAIAYPLRICQKTDRPQILALLLYLLMCSMTIEPLAHGHFVYWGFLFYIMVLARQSQAKALKAKRKK